jgi:hypothetical protein
VKKAIVKKAAVILPLVAGIGAGVATWASSPVSVTPTLLARGSYDPFKVKAEDKSLGVDFKAHDPVDIVVRRHDYAATTGELTTTTGWHTHPGPVFITVVEGSLTFYEYDDPSCTPHVLTATDTYKPGYVDTGHGHMVRNETSQPAQDVTVILAPPGQGFRGELSAPNPYCGF